MSYNDSRAEGTRAMVAAMTDMNNRCPLTSYVLIGFSQGAVIAGDVASDIGNGRGPVDEDLVLGVTLIADGRRQQGWVIRSRLACAAKAPRSPCTKSQCCPGLV